MNRQGFSLLETMISLAIVAMAVLSTAAIIYRTAEYNRKNQILFKISQKADELKSRYMSLNFEAASCAESFKSFQEDGLNIRVRIGNRSDTLKRIILNIQKNDINYRSVFMKSKYIFGGKNE